MSLVHNIDSVTHTDQFGQLRGNHYYCFTCLCHFSHQFVNFKFCTYVDTSGGFIQNQHFRISHHPFCQQYLLLVTAGQRLDRCFQRGCFYAHFLEIFAYDLFFFFSMGMTAIEEFFQSRQAGIFTNASHGNDAIASAVFRQHYHTGLCRIGYLLDRQFLAVYLYRTAIDGIQAKQTAHHFCTACAYQTGKTNDFTFADMERNVFEQLAALQIFYFQQRFTDFNFFFRVYIFHTAAYHQRDDFVDISIFRSHALYNSTVTEYCDVIGNTEYFIHLMGNINDSTAFCFQNLDLFEQQFNFLLCDRGSGLVHYDDGRIIGDRLHDLQHLDIRCCQRFQFICRFIGKVFIVQQFFCFFTHFFPFYSAHAIYRQTPQKNIFFYRHFGDVVQFLSDHSDTQRSCYNRIFDFYRLFIDKNFAGIGFIDPVDDFHQCRLPCAIFTAKRMHSPFSNCKVNLIQRLYTRKRFFNF